MSKTIMISESKFGKLLIHIRALEVENGVSGTFSTVREVRVHTGGSGRVKDDSFRTRLLICNTFETVVELLTGNGWWKRVESVGTLTMLIGGLRWF